MRALSVTVCWEEGQACESCQLPIALGEQMLYKRHLACARKRADDHRRDTGESEGILAVAHQRLADKGRVVLTSGQLRELIALACGAPGFRPVRKPDAGTGRKRWYGGIRGWDPARVAAGLPAAEVAGLWLDYLDCGRMPPLKLSDLRTLMGVIEPSPVTAP